MIELYANECARDLQAKISAYINIPVYCGCTADQLLQAIANQQAYCPCILLEWNILPQDATYYPSLTPDGQWTYRYFDINSYAFSLNISANVIAPGLQTVSSLSNIVQSIYSAGTTLLFPNQLIVGESVPVSLQTTPSQVLPLQLGSLWSNQVPLCGSNDLVVCFPNANDLSLIGQNQKTEAELVSIAAQCAKKTTPQADRMISTKYKYLTSPSGSWKKGLKQSGLSKGEVKTALAYARGNLKMVKKAYDKDGQIDQDLFMGEFADIIPVLPDLYQRAMNHEPFEATYACFQNNVHQYQAKKDHLCDLLGIPQNLNLNIGDHQQPREALSLTSIATAMAENPSLDAKTAAQEWVAALQEVHEENEARDRHNQELADMVTGMVVAGMTARAAGKLGNLADIATGKVSASSGMEKRDLLGSSACIIGKTVHGYKVNSCDPMRCPVRTECLRG